MGPACNAGARGGRGPDGQGRAARSSPAPPLLTSALDFSSPLLTWQVFVQEDEEGRAHLRNLSCHPAASEEEALNLVRARQLGDRAQSGRGAP